MLADKWQAMPHAGCPLAAVLARRTGRSHPDTPYRHMAIDACALHMISEPWQFDVVVTENCFGDILSDIAGGLIGGVGAGPVGEHQRRSPAARCSSPCTAAPPTSREPGPPTRRPRSWLHALMLRHLGFTAEAAAVEAAWPRAIEAGECTGRRRWQPVQPGGRRRRRAAARLMHATP